MTADTHGGAEAIADAVIGEDENVLAVAAPAVVGGGGVTGMMLDKRGAILRNAGLPGESQAGFTRAQPRAVAPKKSR